MSPSPDYSGHLHGRHAACSVPFFYYKDLPCRDPCGTALWIKHDWGRSRRVVVRVLVDWRSGGVGFFVIRNNPEHSHRGRLRFHRFFAQKTGKDLEEHHKGYKENERTGLSGSGLFRNSAERLCFRTDHLRYFRILRHGI